MDHYSFIYIMIMLMYIFLTKTHQAQASQMQFQQVRICPMLGLLLSYKSCHLQCMSSIEGRNKMGNCLELGGRNAVTVMPPLRKKRSIGSVIPIAVTRWKRCALDPMATPIPTLAGAINILMTRVVSQYNGPSGLDRPLTILICGFAWSIGPQQAKYLPILHS